MFRHILICWVALFLALSVDCSQEQSPSGPGNKVFDLDGGGIIGAKASDTEILSAFMSVFVAFPNGQTVNVHQVVSDWDSGSVTWASFAGAFSPDVEDCFLADAQRWCKVDITSLVRAWVAGYYENFGVLLDQPLPAALPALIYSKEKPGYEPFLEICRIAPISAACDTFYPSADVQLDEALPDATIGSSTVLLIGQTAVQNAEKQALIRFNLQGFDLTPGLSTIGGLVWNDVDEDGIYNPAEPGMSKVRIRLYDCQDSLLTNTLSNPDGSYRFDSLDRGSYVVEFLAPDRYVFSPLNQGDNDSLDSDVDPETGQIGCFDIGEDEVQLHWNAGMYVPVDNSPQLPAPRGLRDDHASLGLRSRGCSWLPAVEG